MFEDEIDILMVLNKHRIEIEYTFQLVSCTEKY